MDLAKDIKELPDSEAFQILAESPISMVLTDPGIEDNPIVYVNRAFERVTGYSASAAVGRNCRFLQGAETDPEDVRRIQQALADKTETTVDILNYGADGAPFLNRLLLSPIYDRDGNLRHFLGIQKRLTETEAQNSVNVTQHTIRELKHRVKNHLAMIVSMIRLQGRSASGVEAASSLARRVESLQLLYDELSDPSSGAGKRDGNVSLGAYISRLVNTTAHLDGRAGVRVNMDVDDATCNSEQAAKIGLVVSEIVTNALQHAFEGREEGLLDVRMTAQGDDIVEIVVADDGVGLPEDTSWPSRESVGGRVVTGLLQELRAERDVTSGPNGTTIRLKIPVTTEDD
ncbi:PAS domain-containing protein [Psychromarinibacter sp. C21-152]|uniref:histidine kinase n=1 Tax=Psychromarinibacter sediminicola TaxID=3033385 RepID=A0AAE3NQL8_9RHOB|nr:PAS domain-containing protein [Psychromarinibacter sediminicola]MDF0602418.1 PAS domain-containing protein [Psychromarinibacter sediminicola]